MKDSGKTYSRISTKEVAEALGADLVIGPIRKDNQGREYFEIVVVSDNSKSKRVYRLSGEESDEYKIIGTAEGQNFSHCLFLSRHLEDWVSRICRYDISEPTQPGMAMRVAFYEKN